MKKRKAGKFAKLSRRIDFDPYPILHSVKKNTSDLLDQAYLKLGDTSLIATHNELVDPYRDQDYVDNPLLEVLNYMSKPEHFHFTCKQLLNIDILPFQQLVLKQLWTHKFPMLVCSRGFSKSWLLATYAFLRAIFHQGSTVVLIGAAFRQSKIIFEYMENMWKSADMLKAMWSAKQSNVGPLHQQDRWVFHLGRSKVIAVALGDGKTIRGLRANYIITDEFSSVPREVFETVIRGFASVSAEPHLRVKLMAKIKHYEDTGQQKLADHLKNSLGTGNQIVLSGTTDYIFNHFYDYWRRYKAFIETKGDIRKLQETIGGEIPEGFNWKDYCIIRVPYQMLPKGFLDEDTIAQGKTTMDSSTFIREFEAGWPKDSAGFFKRSIIEQCTCRPTVVVYNSEVSFHARLEGESRLKYVIGVDPASETDNLAIVVLELNDNPIYRKIVYCWTMNRLKLRERLQRMQQSTDVNFYSYCARKIRDLSRRFPTDHIGIDAMGGGIQLFESLHDPTQIEIGEQKFWPYIRRGDNDVFWWEKPDKPTDGEQGLHNIHAVQFASSDWVREANHGLRFDFENKLLLFPCYDALTSTTQDLSSIDITGDTLEDIYLEIEEMKNELASVVHSQTISGRDKWDTPEIKLLGNKKGRLRKDRYTALLIANEVARVMTKEEIGQIHYRPVGGFVGNQSKPTERNTKSGQLYVGPSHIISQMTGVYGVGVSRYK